MPDVSQPGGNRLSRSPRSSSRLDRPTVRKGPRTIQRRAIADENPGPGLANLGQSIGSFFGTLSEGAGRIQAIDDEEADLRATQEAFTWASQNRKEAVAAVRTGDFSTLPENVRTAIGRRAGFNMLRRAAARNLGQDMAEQFHLSLAQNPGQDPEALRGNMMRDELRGADDMLDAHATETFLEATERAVSSAKQAEIASVVEDNFDTFRVDVLGQLQRGEIVTTNDIDRIEAEAFAIGSVVGPESALKFRESIIFEIMKEVEDPENGGRALALLDLKNGDGIRLSDRYPEQALAAREHWLIQTGKVQEAAEKRSLMDLRVKHDRGEIDASTAIELLESDHIPSWGETDASIALRVYFRNQLSNQASSASILDMWRTGQRWRGDEKTWSKHGHTAMAQGLMELSQAIRDDDEQGATEYAAAIGATLKVLGSTTEIKNLFNHMLQDQGQREMGMQLLQSIQAGGTNPEEFLDGDSLGVWQTIENARRSGLDENAELEAYNQNKAAGPRFKPSSVFREQYGLELSQVNDILDDQTDQLLSTAQSMPGTEGVDSIAPTLRNALERSARQIAVAHPNWTPETVFNYARAGLAQRMTTKYVDGEFVADLQHPFAETELVDINGEVQPVRSWSTTDLQQLLREARGVFPSTTEFGQLIHEDQALTEEDTKFGEASPLDIFEIRTSVPGAEGGVHVVLKDRTTGLPIETIGRIGDEIVVRDGAMAHSRAYAGMEKKENADGTWTITVAEGAVNDQLAWVADPADRGLVKLRGFPPSLEKKREMLAEIQARVQEQEFQAAFDTASRHAQLQGELDFKQRIADIMRDNTLLPGQGRAVDRHENFEAVHLRKHRSRVAESLVRQGKLSADLAIELNGMQTPQNADEVEQQIMQIIMRERGRVRVMRNFNAPEHLWFREEISQNGFFWEGFRSTVYDAGDGRETVGFGLNLTDNPNAPKILRALGLEFDRVRAGSQPMTRDQAAKAFVIDMGIRARDMANRFTKEEHQRIPTAAWHGLLDLAYNANPGLFSESASPTMMAALKSGDMKAAAVEIAMDTMGGTGRDGRIPEKLAPGVLARRFWQAAKVANVPVHRLHELVPGILPYREALEHLYPGITARRAETIASAEARLGGSS